MHYIQNLALNPMDIITVYTEVNNRQYNAAIYLYGLHTYFTVRLVLACSMLPCLINPLNFLIGTPEKLKITMFVFTSGIQRN
jgi:hypothetical protein